VEEIDTVILAADANNKIMILHSPKNFGGTRSRPDNKVVCMLGLGAHAMCVLIDLRTALADCLIMVPVVTDLSDCKSAEYVANIPAPEENGLVGFERSSIFIPPPVLRDAILASTTTTFSDSAPPPHNGLHPPPRLHARSLAVHGDQ